MAKEIQNCKVFSFLKTGDCANSHVVVEGRASLSSTIIINSFLKTKIIKKEKVFNNFHWLSFH